MTHNDDSGEDDVGYVDGGASASWVTARTITGLRGPVNDL